MEPFVVQDPDGTSRMLGVHIGDSIRPTAPLLEEDAGPAATCGGGGVKINTSKPVGRPRITIPFEELDSTAQDELRRMQKQDDVYVQQHAPADEDFNRMLQQDQQDNETHETFITYEAASGSTDHAIRSAIESSDTALQAAVATAAAGTNPILPPQQQLPSTAGMDWLQRMKAADEALQRAVDRADAPLRR